jgi:hypothetical protein
MARTRTALPPGSAAVARRAAGRSAHAPRQKPTRPLQDVMTPGGRDNGE